MTIIREMLLTSSYDFTHHTEKKVLTIDRKNCLPSSEKTAYRGQKKVLTADRKNSLPNDGKIILPRAQELHKEDLERIESLYEKIVSLTQNGELLKTEGMIVFIEVTSSLINILEKGEYDL